MKKMKTRVLIIGGGITGSGIARDLTLRGIACILVEKKDLNAGASGANHGLLHSGARYVANDPEAAIECCKEGRLLKRMAPHCIEDCGGIFVAVAGDDENHVADFPHLCDRCGISVEALDIQQAREMEPVLSKDMIAAYRVEDAAIDPFRLTLENTVQAAQHGCSLLLFHEIRGFDLYNGRILTTRLHNRLTGEDIAVEADQVINAAGAWAGDIAAMASTAIRMIYSKGSLLISDHRIAGRVINRLHPSSDADILVPGGTVSILGTTSNRIESLSDIRPTIEEINYIVDAASSMIPALRNTRYIRAYAGVRPLILTGDYGDDRTISRGFSLFDHASDGISNFTSIAGGKLTTYRLMAEKTVDLLCQKLNISVSCPTRQQKLPVSDECQWTQPGHAPKMWFRKKCPDDLLLCECEMVPMSTTDHIVDFIHTQKGNPDLKGIGLRSRIGKGTCQGTFCALREIAYMYDRGYLKRDEGINDLKSFLNGRWKGIRPVLWGAGLVQEELQEALHCGIFGLEL